MRRPAAGTWSGNPCRECLSGACREGGFVRNGKGGDHHRPLRNLSADQRAALIFSAASGETHSFHSSSFCSRKWRAPSSPVAWLSVIQDITPLTVALVQDRLPR